MVVKVPAEMVDFTPKGKVSVKKTLTKMGSISKSQKKPSIKIMPSADGEVHVIEGKKVSVPELKDTMKKVKEMEKKNKGRDIFAKEPKESFSTKVKKYASNLVLDKKTLPPLPSLSEGAKWGNKKLYEDLKKAHKLMDDTNPLGWKASIEGLENEKKKLSQVSSLSANHDVVLHNIKYFENLVRKNKSLLTKDFRTDSDTYDPKDERFKEQNELDMMRREDVRIPKPKSKEQNELDMMRREDVRIPTPKGFEVSKKKYIQIPELPTPTEKLTSDLLKRIFKDLTDEDITFIVEHDVPEDDITKMQSIRYRFSKLTSNEFTKANKKYLKPSINDSSPFAKWKKIQQAKLNTLEEQEQDMMEQEDVRIPEPKTKTRKERTELDRMRREDVRIPEEQKKANKSFMDDLEFLKKPDVAFILKQGMDEEDASEIDNIRSMIEYYIKTLEIKEHLNEAVNDLMKLSKRDSTALAKWKNFSRQSIMDSIHAVKKPTQRDLIKKNYPDLTKDDIDIIVEHDLEHADISKMDLIRNRFKGRKELPPRVIKEYLKPEEDDSSILKKWKIAQIVFMTE
jgi:hypothetical protein